MMSFSDDKQAGVIDAFNNTSRYLDFNTRNKLLTQKFLKQGYRYHTFRKTFS